MAVQIAGTDITYSAASDMSAKQYQLAEFTSVDKQVEICNGAGDIPVGFLQNKPSAAGQGAVIRIAGTSKAKAGGTVAGGAAVGTDAAGKVVAKSSAGDKCIGFAVTDAVNNDVFEVRIDYHILHS